MDLSLKKQEVHVPQDLPQDLSLKKPVTSGTPASKPPHHQPPFAARPAEKTSRVTAHTDKTNSLLQHSKSGMVPPLMEHKSRIVPSLIEQKSRIIPDLDQYIRAMMDLKPIFADQHLRTLAHQKAKSLSSQSKKTADVRCAAALVVPKRSALVIPDPRNRAASDQRTKQHETNSHGVPDKGKTSTSDSTQQHKQVMDLRKRNHITHTITERLLSNDLHQNEYVTKDAVRALQGEASRHVTASNWTVPMGTEDKVPHPLTPQSTQSTSLTDQETAVSRKKRRKQECPRKRVKVDFCPPAEEEAVAAEGREGDLVGGKEEEDPVFSISEEFLDKVTDAAQNGELRKGLDEYFAQASAQRMSEADGRNGEGEADTESAAERAASAEHLRGECDEGVGADNDGSSSPSSSTDGLSSPFQFCSSASPSPLQHHRQKGKQQSRLSASLQNREERKALRLYGKEYTTPSGKTYPQRQVRHKDCSRCRYNCSSTISREQRQALFDHFWSLDSYVKRLYYYCQSIKEKPAKTMKHTRECSREYTFLVEGERVRVCKGFYLATLDVSDKAVRIAMEKRKRGKGMWDKRGAHPPHNKTRPEDRDRVRSHIESALILDIYSKTVDGAPTAIPGQDLNVTKLHQDYVQVCQQDGKEPVSEDVYRKTFNTEYNLATVQV
ncbi:uncharacterized protein LOC143274927 [Babylonia areolata]|uniref:uncharacterized protein LOC143274927 n=1 Tax=Babylonia areolata TaxID=304850 RepID=UPI003FD3D3D1